MAEKIGGLLDFKFWNVNRLSFRERASKERLRRVMDYALSGQPGVVGLSEVYASGLAQVKRIAEDQEYQIVCDAAMNKINTLLLIKNYVHVNAYGTWRRNDPLGGRLDCEAAYAACEIRQAYASRSVRILIASVYNYSADPIRMAQALQDLANNYTEGHLVAGGDWNMSRSLDDDEQLKHLGSSAFDAISKSFSWKNVLPGSSGTEVPTWPLSKLPSRPRQLDHLFVKLPAGIEADCQVKVPAPGQAALSDHALLAATIRASPGLT